MHKTIASLCLLAVASLAGGCLNVRADASGLGAGAHSPRASVPPDPASDPRGLGDLQRENAQLRSRLAELEAQHRQSQATIDAQKSEIHSLKKQRDALEKERDRYKDAIED
jgi:septal ring factor EnvC (AmiA/AmiB activator)